MKRSGQILVVFYSLNLFIASHVFGVDKVPGEPWMGKLADGTEITESDLNEIIKKHEKWLNSEGTEGEKADLSKADIRNANIKSYSNLEGAKVYEINLSGSNLIGVNLSKTDLTRADLSNANLTNADLSTANLTNADLSSSKLFGATLNYAQLPNANLSNTDLFLADLSYSNLENSKFSGANLKKADLSNAKLVETDLTNCDLRNCILPDSYEPKVGSVPYIASVIRLPNLDKLTYENYPHGLVELREGFKKYGYREQERKLTYALKHTTTRASLNSENIFRIIEGIFNLCLFEYTSKWGMSPGRPLIILLILIVLFSCFYIFSLFKTNKQDGIWKVWIEGRVRSDIGEAEPKLLTLKKFLPICGYGFYFSLLSAFNIGWRELNVGNWIARLHPREYTLRATGWVRTVSGIQSLISVYLLALAVLTYFGRPFDQF